MCKRAIPVFINIHDALLALGQQQDRMVQDVQDALERGDICPEGGINVGTSVLLPLKHGLDKAYSVINAHVGYLHTLGAEGDEECAEAVERMIQTRMRELGIEREVTFPACYIGEELDDEDRRAILRFRHAQGCTLDEAEKLYRMGQYSPSAYAAEQLPCDPFGGGAPKGGFHA